MRQRCIDRARVESLVASLLALPDAERCSDVAVTIFADSNSQGPGLICRSSDGLADEIRASTYAVVEAETEALPFNGGGYVAKVEAFVSEDDEDRGGVVLRLTSTSQIDDGSFIPTARGAVGGVEIHIGGESESAAFLEALRAALDLLPQ